MLMKIERHEEKQRKGIRMKDTNNILTSAAPCKDTETETAKIYDLFEEYRNSYAQEWERLAKCDRLYRGEHWKNIPVTSPNEPRPVTPIIQSTIENVRSELSDYYPQAIICADSPEHSKAAEVLCAVIRENHVACDYETEYAKLIYDLLVGGYMVQETGFDAEMNYGLGGAYIRHVDNRNIMFDPTAVCIDDCRAIFKFTAHNYAWYKMHYPDKVNSMVFDEYALKNTYDDVLRAKHEDECLLIECWIREYDAEAGRYKIHMIKLAGRVKLEDSREAMPDGLYSHGKYPFTVTTLFTRKGCCLGYGYADMFEQQQILSDKLDQIVLKNALMASHNKLLVSSASGFDVNDLRDWSKEVHRGENINGVKWFATAPLPAYIIEYAHMIRESVREESGTNDFSRGSTTGGVTAASAISALMEMSNKRSRDIARRIHNSFAEAVRMEIEVERDYSVFARPIAVNSDENVVYSNALLRDGDNYPLEFRVSIKVQKETKFAVLSHNETILKLVELNMITPEIGLEMLIFDGKQEAISKMQDRATGKINAG